MTDEEWLSRAAGLMAAQSKVASLDYDVVRRALAETYSLMAYAGANPEDIYGHIPESELRGTAAGVFERLSACDWSWDGAAGGVGEAVPSVAARIRALDRLLKHVARHNGPPVNPEADWLDEETGWYVVPRLTARTPRPGYGTRSSFGQRGTLEHRLLPRRIGSYEVSLHWLADIVGASEPPVFGAGMFENFRLDLEGAPEPEAFVAAGLRCPSAAEHIAQVVVRANEASCYCLAWPELTMRPEVEGRVLSHALRNLSLSDVRGGSPAFTLAGSWHVGEGSDRKNAAPVLDACGDAVLVHRKARAYADNGVGIEAICPDYRIPVLVTENHLVAFAICKDFCDLRQGIPYPFLNVDLVVVGSIGNEQTMGSHRAMAGQAEANGTGVVVVQQDLETGEGETGWVIRPATGVLTRELGELRRGSWSTR